MRLRIWTALLLALLLSSAAIGCDSKEGKKEEATTPPNEKPETPPEPPGPPPLPPLPPPPGPPGVVKAQLGEAVGLQVAATTEKVLWVYRRHFEEAGACPNTETGVCDKWLVSSSPRPQLDEAAPTFQSLSESDTPSGIALEDLKATQEGWASLWREGRYTEDPARLVLSRSTPKGIEQQEMVPLSTAQLRGASLCPVGKDWLVCWSALDSELQGAQALASRSIWCSRAANPSAAWSLRGGEGEHHAPVLVAVEGGAFLTWVRGETQEGQFLDAEGKPKGELIELGPAVPMKAAVAVGHGGLLVVNQAPQAYPWARRVELNGECSERLSLETLGLRKVPARGVAAVSQGWLLSLSASEGLLALLDPRGERVRALGAQQRPILLMGYGAVQQGEDGNWQWQPAQELLAEPQPK